MRAQAEHEHAGHSLLAHALEPVFHSPLRLSWHAVPHMQTWRHLCQLHKVLQVKLTEPMHSAGLALGLIWLNELVLEMAMT